MMKPLFSLRVRSCWLKVEVEHSGIQHWVECVFETGGAGLKGIGWNCKCTDKKARRRSHVTSARHRDVAWIDIPSPQIASRPTVRSQTSSRFRASAHGFHLRPFIESTRRIKQTAAGRAGFVLHSSNCCADVW